MKTKWKIVKEITSWAVLIAMIVLLGFTTVNAIKAQRTGESNFLFGYRPVLVLTGSMEPYMMTNSIALTKEVTSLDQLEVGDVVTYHVTTEAGKLIRITHRITALDGDLIYTKGDNNNVADGYALTLDNIEAEVISVFNQTAWVAAKWQTTAGKIMIISFTAFLVCLIVALDVSISNRRREKEEAAIKAQLEAEAAEPQIAEGGEVKEEVAEPAEAVVEPAPSEDAEAAEEPFAPGEQSDSPDTEEPIVAEAIEEKDV